MLAARRAFKDFNGDNDSWGEHDMGALDVVIDGVPERIFFNSNTTIRMLASEY